MPETLRIARHMSTNLAASSTSARRTADSNPRQLTQEPHDGPTQVEEGQR